MDCHYSQNNFNNQRFLYFILNFKEKLFDKINFIIFASPIAGIAQLVEHDLAKVGVAGPSPVSRSKESPCGDFFCPGGGIGRHAGLKIL